MAKIEFTDEIEELRIEMDINKVSLHHFLKKLPVDSTMEEVISAIKDKYGEEKEAEGCADCVSEDEEEVSDCGAKEEVVSPYSSLLNITSNSGPKNIFYDPITGRPV